MQSWGSFWKCYYSVLFSSVTQSCPTLCGRMQHTMAFLSIANSRSHSNPCTLGWWTWWCIAIQIGTCHWHLPSTSKMMLRCCYSCWLSILPENSSGWRSGKRHPILWEEKWPNRSSDSWIISGVDFMSPVLVLPCIQKCTETFHGDVCLSWLTVTFTRLADTVCKNMCLTACISLLPKSHRYWPSPLPLWSSFLELSEILSPRL